MAITKATFNVFSSALASGNATDGYVLTADGSGNAAWEEVAGGPTFKTFGTSSIMIGDTTTGTIDAANYNTGLGVDVFTSLTTGDNNVALGFNALASATTGSESVAIGAGALDAVTTQGTNVAVGYSAATSLTTTGVVAIGYKAMETSTTGYDTVAIGSNTLKACTTGNENVAVGFNAMANHTTGSDCVAIGNSALLLNTTGSQNTAVGRAALDANTTSSYSTAVGADALTTSTGPYNTAMGVGAMGNNTTGQQNTAIGYHSCVAQTTALYNSALGLQSGRDVTSGSDNVFLGYRAGDGPSPSGSITTQSNNIVIGNNSSTNAYIKIAWTVTSDKRDKTDIEPLTMGLDLVNKLEPVTYKWDMRSDYEDGNPNGTHKKEKLCGGLLAQDVEKLEREYGYKVEDKTSILTDKNADGNYGLTYEKFVPVLINAVKELSTKIEELENKLENK